MAAATPSSSATWLSAPAVTGILAAHLAGVAFVNYHAPAAYMDEPFHVPMTVKYCNGDFLHWDPKITTFPGLYVLGSAYATAAAALTAVAGAGRDVFCSGPFLRSLNAFLSTACYQLAHGVYALSHSSSATSAAASSHQRQSSDASNAWAAAAIASLPTHLFFAFLYYTDVAALLFLLLTQHLLLRRRPHAAAAAGAAAIGVRQTNAVWVTFLVGAAVLRDLGVLPSPPQQGTPAPATRAARDRPPRASGKHPAAVSSPGPAPAAAAAAAAGAGEPAGRSSSAAGFASGCCSELAAALRQLALQWPLLLRRYWSCLLLPVAFAAFVAWNGGIALGDREAHAPVTHLMQPLYFGGFALAAAGPLLATPSALRGLLGSWRRRPAACGAWAAAAVAAATYCVQRHTLEHPYLLADNRHYTFYLWRRLMSRGAARHALIPAYLLGWALLLQGLAGSQGHLWALAYAAATVVTLAPAWLLEFRYFTPPLVLALLHLPAPDAWRAKATAAAYVGCTAALLYVFCCRPFAWGDGSVARFMW